MRAGADARVALQVTLPEGFHVQSNKPRDPTLIPTELTVDAPAGVTVAEIVFPPTVDLKLVGVDQPLAVFERTFAIGVRLHVASTVAPGERQVPAQLRYQACNDTTCFAPTTADAAVDAARGAGERGASAAAHATCSARSPSATARRPPKSSPPAAPAAAPRQRRGGSWTRASQASTTSPSWAPRAAISAATSSSQFIHNAENGVKDAGLFEGRGPLAILLLVFLGGLALNLTPCVLPMIPINLAIIGAGAQAGSRGRGFLLGGVYGAAMALVYGVLGLVVILTAGTFGTINASPWFNLGIAVLFVVLALAMFDVITIDFSRFSSGIRVGDSSRGTFLAGVRAWARSPRCWPARASRRS